LIQKRFRTDFTCSEIVLISIGEGGGGGSTKNFLESEHYLAIPSERAGFTRLPHGHGRGKLGNITMIIFLLIRLHFTIFTTRLSQHQMASERLLTIDFSFFSAPFNLAVLGYWPFQGESRSSISSIMTGLAWMGFLRYHLAAWLIQISFICFCYHKIGFTFALVDTWSSHIITTSALASYPRQSLQSSAPFASCNYGVFRSLRNNNRNSTAVRSCWRVVSRRWWWWYVHISTSWQDNS
jgi:hypothetical protein